jgi:hypothetical protein
VLSSFYNPQTRALLQLPGSNSTSLYTDAQLTIWINIARGQVAGEGECIRAIGTVPTIVGNNSYAFSSVSFGSSSANGIQGAINIQRLSYVVGGGQLWISPRAWPWFTLYNLNNAVPPSGAPQEWSQFGQGAAPGVAGSNAGTVGGGSFYVSPLPDDIYTLNADACCYPIPLVDDTTVEALPYFWTDAVPFFAAYFALMSAQTNARMADAAQMYKGHYNEFMERARKQSNPSVINTIYPQSGDPAQGPKMGIKGGAGG